MTLWKSLLKDFKWILTLLAIKPMPPTPPPEALEVPPEPIVSNPPDTRTLNEKLYEVAKSNLGKDISLDQSIPNELQCAQAASFVIKQVKSNAIPVHGISGTAALYQWMKDSPLFEETFAPSLGSIIINATGTGKNTIRGHCGIVAKYDLMYKNDAGVMSNDSNTGTLREQWSLKQWDKYYRITGGMPTHYFNLL